MASPKLCFSVILCCIVQVNLICGQNLVNNPGFESYSPCPSSFGQIANATGWGFPSGHTGSPDYLNNCGGMGTTHPSSNYFGSETPHGGNGMAGFATYYLSTPNFREYLQTQLSSPLIAGTTYSVSFYVSVGDVSQYSSDGIQVHFRNTAGAGSGNWSPLPYIPQVVQPAGVCIGSRSGWTLFTGNFVAAGGESYMIVGNFDNDAATFSCYIGPGSYSTAYYYFDDFVVQPASMLAADLLGYSGQLKDGVARIFWKTTNEQQVVKYIVERSTDLIHFEAVGEVEAKGSRSEESQYQLNDTHLPVADAVYYRLVSVNTQGALGFSQTITLRPDHGTPHLSTLFPNPVAPGESVTATWSAMTEEVLQVSLWDPAGRQVLSTDCFSSLGLNELTLPIENLAPGIYLFRAKGQSTDFSEKLVLSR